MAGFVARIFTSLASVFAMVTSPYLSIFSLRIVFTFLTTLSYDAYGITVRLDKRSFFYLF